MKKGLQETRGYSKATIKLENIDHHTLNGSQNLNILSLVSQLPNLDCFVGENFKNL